MTETEIDVGMKVYLLRGRRTYGPFEVDNKDEESGKRWINSIDDEECLLVDEKNLFLTREAAFAAVGRKINRGTIWREKDRLRKKLK